MTIENIKLYIYIYITLMKYIMNVLNRSQQLIRYFFKRIDIYEDWTLEKLIKSIEHNIH